jgi:thymidylate synthase
MLTKDYIVNLLQTNDKAVGRALVVLTARQTSDEQVSEQTRYLNGRGYRPCHARMGASMSKFYQRNGYLSVKQVAYWRSRDKSGAMRIGIYAGQLLEVAQEKAAQKNKVETDERARLEYNLGMVMDSDDPAIIAPAKNEPDDFMAKIREKNK